MPVVVCSECETKLNVPDNIIGKKIRCKSCSSTFVATAQVVKAAKPTPKAVAKPDAGIKEIKKAPEAKPAAGVKNAKAVDPDNDGANYTLNTDEDDTKPRCPHCAKELSMENARICLNCGYDTVLRKRNITKAVYQPTFGEKFIHLLPGIAALSTVIGIITGCVFCFLRMKEWAVGSFLEAEGSTVEKRDWNINPGIVTLWTCVFSAFIGFKLAKTAYKRLCIDYRPKENTIKAEK